jgi:hypothetical protein
MAKEEIEDQINDLVDHLRRLRAFYCSLIYGKDRNASRFLNFLKRIWSRAKAVIEVILFIEGIHDTIVRVMNMIFPQSSSSLKEYAY